MWLSLRHGLGKMNLYSLFSYIAPVLIVLTAVTVCVDKIYPSDRWPRIFKFFFLSGLAIFALIPFGGISVASLLLSPNPNYSIGLVVLLFVALARRLWGVPMFSSKDLFYFSLFNTVLGILLYGGSLGFLPYDIYTMGYDFSLIFWIICGLTIAMVLFESRLQWVFICYIVAWNFGLLPSPNFLDYIIDPILFLLSFAFLVGSIARIKRTSEGS